MGVLTQILQLILSLSILILFHELGHFGFAKLFKTRVEKFYLFFDPWFSLFKFKRGDTEYGMGWIPLGGYVKISGMIDESMDTEQLKKDPQPWEFRTKKAWQRLLIMLGGVLVNFVLAIIIYAGVLFTWGEKYLPSKNLTYGIAADSLWQSLGFQNGDKIIMVNGEEAKNHKTVYMDAILTSPHSLTVQRNDTQIEIVLTDENVAEILKNPSFPEPRIPFIISEFVPDAPAESSGLQIKDKIIGINDMEILYFDEFRTTLQNFKNQNVKIKALRNTDTVIVEILVPATGKIGVAPIGEYTEFFEVEIKEYGILSAIPAGIKRGQEEIASYLKQLKLVFTPKTEAYKSVGSFITITKIFPKLWDWQSFWMLTAMFSIMLAVLNILPIPALDGGHVMFLLVEIITRRKPSDKFMTYAQYVGMAILGLLMIYAIGNDFVRNF